MKDKFKITVLIIAALIIFPSVIFTGKGIIHHTQLYIFAGDKSSHKIESSELKDKYIEEEKKISAEEKKNTAPSNDDSVIIKVMFVIIAIWLGISLFIFKIDRRLKKLEKRINEL